MASVTISGVDQVTAALRKVESALQVNVAQAVADEADAIADDERSRVPVGRTGALRDGIEVVATNDGAEIGPRDPELYYAIFVEWGRSASNYTTTPFATPAAERSRARWPKRAAEAVKRAADA